MSDASVPFRRYQWSFYEEQRPVSGKLAVQRQLSVVLLCSITGRPFRAIATSENDDELVFAVTYLNSKFISKNTGAPKLAT